MVDGPFAIDLGHRSSRLFDMGGFRSHGKDHKQADSQVAKMASEYGEYYQIAKARLAVTKVLGAGTPTNMDYDPTRWPQSPRIVMRCAPRASNGPDHLGLCALQGTASRGRCSSGARRAVGETDILLHFLPHPY